MVRSIPLFAGCAARPPASRRALRFPGAGCFPSATRSRASAPAIPCRCGPGSIASACCGSGFTIGEFALGLFAGRGCFLVFFGESVEFGLVALGLVAELVDSLGNRRQRLLELVQLPVDDLKVISRVISSRNSSLLFASRRFMLVIVPQGLKPANGASANGTRMIWAHQDLNLGPAGYEPAALNLAELWAL